jgi:membrane peptidoglycan carboxypeptidase
VSRIAAITRHRRHRRAISARELVVERRSARQLACGSIVLVFVLLLATVVGVAGVGLLAAYQNLTAGLPSAAALTSSTLPQTTRIYDRTGTHVLAEIYVEDRDSLPLVQMGALAVNATVAVEDRTFWTNPGVDVTAILRAAVSNASGSGQQSGASTITQQLVKRFLVGDEQSYVRKLREAILANRVSTVMTKEQVLDLYMNAVYYGEQAYGVGAAARRYFAKAPGDLTIGQAAMLAGLPQSPSANGPFLHPVAAARRQRVVLDAMVRAGYITPIERAVALTEPLDLVPYHGVSSISPWFSDRVTEQAATLVGGMEALAACGCRIRTTLDWSMQITAQRDVTTFIRRLPKADKAHNAALVAEDPATGEVLAYVGSVDPKSRAPQVQGAFDSAGVGLRSPGSAWKGITYLSAMEYGHLNGSSGLWDVPTTFAPGYKPHDAALNTNGLITVRQAIRESRNIPAIRAMLAYGGTKAMLNMAGRLGITRTFPAADVGPAMAIGTGSVALTDMTAAYSTIDALGVHIEQHRILDITSPEGIALWSFASRPAQVVDAKVVYELVDVLRDNANKNGSLLTGAYADIGRPAGVKTGTEADKKDTYAMGIIPQLAVGVWVGNSDNSQMGPNFYSFNGPLLIWRTFILHVIKARNFAPVAWTRPNGLVKAKTCEDTAKFAGWGFDSAGPCPFKGATEWVIPGVNDPATKLSQNGLRYGTYLTDGTGHLKPVGCAFGVMETGLLAQAERPEWQADLEAWVASARGGGQNNGRFRWNTYNWIFPALPGAGC